MFCKRRTPASAFTLMETLAAIAIIAALVAILIPFVGGMFSSAQQTRDKQTLTILNDALTRYKCEGGNINGLTSGAPISHVIAALQADTNWCGLTHSFLQKGKTYIGRSIDSKGDRQQYRFTRYDTYTHETGGTSPAGGINGIWVVDFSNNRIQKFDSNGIYLSQFGSAGSGDGQFTWPTSLAIDSNDNIWVVDFGNDRIQKFDSRGGIHFPIWLVGSR